MEKNSTTRHVAIVEKCVMTEMAWRYIFSREDNRRYHIHLFKNVSMLRAAEIPFPWSTIIFSLSGSRSSRAESLLFVHEMARCRPEVQTIILANNESEMHLIGHLMPACLHGILNKSAPRRGLQERLLQLLDNHQRQRTILRQRGVQRSAKPDGARHPSVYVVGIFAF